MINTTINKEIQLTGHNASVFTVMPGMTPNTILSGAGEGWVVEWNLDDPENGRLVAQVETNIFSLLYVPQIHQVVVGNMNGGVHWVNLDQPDLTKNIVHHQNGVFDIVAVGDYIFTAGGDGKLTRWSITSQQSLETLHLSNKSLRSIAYAPQRGELAIGASDNNIYIVDANTMEIRQTVENAHDHSVFSVKYTADEQFLISGGRDAHLKIWDSHQLQKPLFSEAAHWFTINDIAIHPKGHIFATGSRDKTIRIWSMDDFRLLKSLDRKKYQGHLNSVNKLFWSPYQNQLISASDDRSLIIWNVDVK